MQASKSSALPFDPRNHRDLYESGEISALAGGGSIIDNRFVRGPGVDEIVANYTGGRLTPSTGWEISGTRWPPWPIR